jgi:hypothetical protein
VRTFDGEVINIPYAEVAPLVEGRSRGDSKTTDCVADFASGNHRAKRSGTYDVQALLSVTCRHYIALYATPIYHGERFGYALASIKRLADDAKKFGVDLAEDFVLCYDVACRFSPFAKNRAGDLAIPTFRYAIGKLHCNTHSQVCMHDYYPIVLLPRFLFYN